MLIYTHTHTYKYIHDSACSLYIHMYTCTCYYTNTLIHTKKYINLPVYIAILRLIISLVEGPEFNRPCLFTIRQLIRFTRKFWLRLHMCVYVYTYMCVCERERQCIQQALPFYLYAN